MIWYALRVRPQKEDKCQQILREDGISSIVPITHAAVRKTRNPKLLHQLRAKSQVGGIVFVGFELGERPNWSKLTSLTNIVIDIYRDGNGYPQEFSPTDIVKICGHSQRPHLVRRNPRRANGRRTRPMKPNSEVISGPYEGKLVRAVFMSGNGHNSEQLRDVDELYEMLSTGT